MLILYSRKCWIGANFCIFRMMPRRTKIKSTKSFTFEILITSNKWAWHSRMRTYENKNTKIYSEGFTAIYTKVCTFQNFPLYGTYSTMLLMSTIVKYVEYNATDEYHCKIRYWCTYSTMLLMSTIVKYGTGVHTVQCY